MTDKDMPEEYVIGDDYGTPVTYRLKSTVDAELAERDKTIRELDVALRNAAIALHALGSLGKGSVTKLAEKAEQALSDNATQIAKARKEIK